MTQSPRMKKLGVLFSTLVLFIILPVAAFAQKDVAKTGKHVILSEGEVINHDYFAAGDIVEVYGTINGDGYVAGGQLIINGTINGDLLAAGGQISIDATISQNARITGGQISIDGNIGRNLTIAGGDITLAKNLTLNGNLVGGMGNLNSQANIAGDVTMGAGNATLGNQIGGDIRAGVGMIRLLPDTVVGGDVIYYSEEDIVLSGDATVSGVLVKKLPPDYIREVPDQKIADQVREAILSFATISRLISLLSSIIIGYLLVHFFPNYSHRLISTIEDRPGASIAVGIAALILAPILSFLLLILVITVPLGFMLAIFYGIALYLSRIFFMYWLGARLLDRMERTADKTLTLFIGIGLYYVLTAIAIIGPIVIISSLLLGLGAMLLTEKRAYLSGRKLKIF